MIKSVYNFLAPKIKEYSFIYLIRWQLEDFFITIASYIPTMLGLIIRYFLLKVLLLKSNGFQWISSGVQIVHPGRIKMGGNVGINSGTSINGVGFIDIGDFVLIGANVTISSGIHSIAGKNPEIYRRPIVPKKIIIERDVWIGAGAVILPGVTLKMGSVIGANSVVNRDTTPYSINVGAPIREIGVR